MLQINPAYVPGPTLGELADGGVIHKDTARFFGRGLQLFKHQEEALRIAQSGHPYVVRPAPAPAEPGLLLPIVDSVFRGNPVVRSVRALVIYLMNALINSQIAALEEFKKKNWPDCPLDFDSYTGQTKQNRNKVLTNSPHILLTNYVMLEYMLIRPQERTLVERMTRDLAFLAVDELHVYRGRQGADVAMLLRRLRQRVRNPGLLCIGTSATIVTKGDRAARREAIAEVGTKLFGVRIEPDHVVDETLQRVSAVPAPTTPSELAAAVVTPRRVPTSRRCGRIRSPPGSNGHLVWLRRPTGASSGALLATSGMAWTSWSGRAAASARCATGRSRRCCSPAARPGCGRMIPSSRSACISSWRPAVASTRP